MSPRPVASPGERRILQTLGETRHGLPGALGRLLELFRPYLLVIAEAETPVRLRRKYSPDDAVQDTLALAVATFASFRGQSGDEVARWLRQILYHQLLAISRYFRAAKRHLAREVSLHDLDPFICRRGKPTASQCSPDMEMERQEENRHMQAARNQLTARHALVLELRQDLKLPFAEVGARLGITDDAARKLHRRALIQLRRHLQYDHAGRLRPPKQE